MNQLTTILLACSFVFQLNAQDKQTPSPIIFICDASGSMWGQMQGKTKMEIAINVLSNSVNNLPENQKIGLVAYGHREKEDCEDVEFLVDVETGTQTQVTISLKNIKPLGKTPLAYSVMQVIDKLRNSKMKATIILVTDGIESCGGNICDVVETARKEGIDFRLHIIGFGLKAGETEQLKCAAKAGNGQYYDAADAEGLGDVINEATTATIDEPDGNFSVYAIKNGKPIDAYVQAFKFGTQTSVEITRTYADTALLYLPPGIYDLEVKPVENSDVDPIMVTNIQSFEDTVMHHTISFDAGRINVIILNNGEGWDAVVNIYAKGKNVTTGRTYGKSSVSELNPGRYDIEVKALTIEGLETTYRMENVDVKANEIKYVEHNFKTGIVMIGAKSANGLVDAVINIVEANAKINVANGRSYTLESSNPEKFILNPGTYQVTLSALGDYKGKKETFTIVIKEGETIEKITNF